MDPKIETRGGLSITEEFDREEKAPKSSSSEASRSSRSTSGEDQPTIGGRESSPKEPSEKQMRSSSARGLKRPQGKKKGKVDWTAELHKKFVQAVDKLGIDKAVPSRILELMGTDRLTRHNVASHLQKYRSHRKHRLARQARGSASDHRIEGNRQANASSTVVRTSVFPQITTLHRHNGPLHVWGHPQSLTYTRRTAPRDHLTFWHWHRNVPAQGFPCYSPYVQTSVVMRTTYGVGGACVGVPVVPNCGQTGYRKPCEFLTSKERIDAVIGDVLSKPWTPLPLGLKAPNVESVMVELQRQGISKVPPK